MSSLLTGAAPLSRLCSVTLVFTSSGPAAQARGCRTPREPARVAALRGRRNLSLPEPGADANLISPTRRKERLVSASPLGSRRGGSPGLRASALGVPGASSASLWLARGQPASRRAPRPGPGSPAPPSRRGNTAAARLVPRLRSGRARGRAGPEPRARSSRTAPFRPPAASRPRPRLASDTGPGPGTERRHGSRGPAGGPDLLHLPGLFRGAGVHRVRPQLLPRLPAPQLGAGRWLVPLPRVPPSVAARLTAAQLGPGPADGEDAAPPPGPRAPRPVRPPPGSAAALLRGRPAARVLGVQGVPGAPGAHHGAHRRGLQQLPAFSLKTFLDHPFQSSPISFYAVTPVVSQQIWYLDKLCKTQCSLKDKIKKAMHLQDMEVKNAAEWKEKVKSQRMRLSVEFAKLHLFLTEEEQLFLQRLSEEEEEMNKKHDENMLKLHQIITSLKQLILEIREKSQSSTLVLLQNPKDVLNRSENQDVNYSPEILKMKTVCQIPMMKEMLKQFQVAVSLAVDTAHPKLVFSQDGRYVKNGASASSWPLFSSAWSYVSGWRNPQKNTAFVERFQHLPCVLGKNVFISGRHYWEVENRDSLEIAVGVCREDVMGLADGSKMSPHVGIWAICWSSAGFWPLTSSPVSPTKQEPALHRVGVFLDSGAGDISFYSAVDGTHLHTFSCPLVSRLRPFFWLSPLASLVIPAVTGGK